MEEERRTGIFHGERLSSHIIVVQSYTLTTKYVLQYPSVNEMLHNLHCVKFRCTIFVCNAPLSR